MISAIKWYSALSLIFGLASLAYFPFVGLTSVFACFTAAMIVRQGQEDMKDQFVEIAKAHFDRQDHEESLK
jgi:hypothetical protein